MLHLSRSSQGFCLHRGGPQGSSDPVTKKRNGTSPDNSAKPGQSSTAGQRRGAPRPAWEKGTCSQPRALGMGSEVGAGMEDSASPCLPSPPQQGSTVDGSYSPKRSPGSKIDVMCALSASPLKSILTALQGTPWPAMNIWGSMSKRARREPQSLNIYIYIRHRNAVLTFGW